MQKKRLIIAGIGVVVVIAGILSGVMLHKKNETVATMAETTLPTVEEDLTALTEEQKTEETEPQTEGKNAEETSKNETDTEQETDVLQEDEEEEEKAEQDMAEVSEDAAMEEIDAYMYTTADLNMRKEGTTESEVIGSIPYGTEIHVTARTADNWYRTERGESGYVSGKYLSEEKPVKQIVQDSTQQQQVQSAGQGSTPPNGISQEDWDQFREAYRSVTGYYPEDMPPYDPSQVTPAPMEGHLLDGSHHLIH